MSVLGRQQIVAGRTQGKIVIEPFDDSMVNNASVDVTIGGQFYRMRRDSVSPLINPYSPDSIKAAFRLCAAEDRIVPGISRNGETLKVIKLAPRERIIAHTEQFIGYRTGGTTKMSARSTWGRLGVSVCMCAGWGDIGYTNRWAMEVENHNDRAIIIVVGTRVAQITFFEMEHAGDSYAGRGKYQETDDIEQLKSMWKPEMMLPRAFDDREWRAA